MPHRRVLAWFAAASIVPAVAVAGSHHGGIVSHPVHHGGVGPGPHHPSQSPSFGGGAGGGGWAFYGFPYYGMVGPNGPMYVAPPLPILTPLVLPLIVDPGPLVGGPMPAAQAGGGVPVRRAKRVDPARMSQLVTIGDRLFRVGNIKRAGERFEQAARADPDAAPPRVRLAQVAISRGQYAEAAGHLRAAVAADPQWLTNAPDIQAIYAEPGDFTRQVGRLESHLVVEPGDRDAWFVLGAQLYLSGQTRRASDIFLRLTDRKPDPSLTAFLDASNAARKPGE